MSPNPSDRRIFWGRSLPQAVAKAARHYRLAPEELSWRRHEKRHGFVKHPRAVLIEVDPDALRRATPAPVEERTETKAASAPSPVARTSEVAPERAPRRPPSAAPHAAPRAEEPYETPDEGSEQAALEAVRRLLRFAGIAARAEVVRRDDRVEVVLSPEAAAIAGAPPVEIDAELLDELDHLLPKAILALSGRRVRASVDFAGRREARAEELRALATAAAQRVRETGESETLPPLPPAERRIVHLLFESDPEIATESVGDSLRKKVRLVRRSS